MRGIFISYRRDDTAAHAGRLYDRLAAHFGAQRVFRDVDSLHPGAEFAAVIEERVAACDALVVLIGNNWLNAADAQGKRKLDQPYDYVRTEIGAALRQRKLVIPALVDGATLPQASELPAEIAALRSRNSLEISERHFAADVQRIIEALDPASARVEPGGNAPPAASPSGFWAWLKNGDNQRTLSFIGAGVAAVAAATWTLYSHFSPPVIPDKPVVSAPAAPVESAHRQDGAVPAATTNKQIEQHPAAAPPSAPSGQHAVVGDQGVAVNAADDADVSVRRSETAKSAARAAPKATAKPNEPAASTTVDSQGAPTQDAQAGKDGIAINAAKGAKVKIQ